MIVPELDWTPHFHGSTAISLLVLFRENTSFIHSLFIYSALSCGVCSLLYYTVIAWSVLSRYKPGSTILLYVGGFFLLDQVNFCSFLPLDPKSNLNSRLHFPPVVVLSSTLRRCVCPFTVALCSVAGDNNVELLSVTSCHDNV